MHEDILEFLSVVGMWLENIWSCLQARVHCELTVWLIKSYYFYMKYLSRRKLSHWNNQYPAALIVSMAENILLKKNMSYSY